MTRNQIIIAVVLIAAAIIIWYIYFRNPNASKSETCTDAKDVKISPKNVAGLKTRNVGTAVSINEVYRMNCKYYKNFLGNISEITEAQYAAS